MVNNAQKTYCITYRIGGNFRNRENFRVYGTCLIPIPSIIAGIGPILIQIP